MVFKDGRTSTYVMNAQSGITFPICKVHLSTVFLTEVLKETSSYESMIMGKLQIYK